MPVDTRIGPGQVSRSTGCGCHGGCARCEGLRPLCRPRFFAGQLVTDADFRRLDEYLVAKGRLHNRYLVGTGVVCGMEVVCNPCDGGTVTVGPGYALGPCGEDIVVGADTRVDVGALVRARRQAAGRVDCGPFVDPPADCEAAEQRWILGICYDEQPGRPVATLQSSSGCASSACGCGGSCGGSCGSGRSAPVSCEPTVTCEGFRFVLTKDTSNAAHRRDRALDDGAIAARVKACLTSLQSRLTPVPGDPTTAELVAYCCTLKAELRDVLVTGEFSDCRLAARLAALRCPAADDPQAADKAREAVAEMLRIVVELFRECACAALLPPCPDPCLDECVPLATLTVASSDLSVLDICPWSSRRFAVTLPALGYWLSWLPFGPLLRRAIGQFCCPPDEPGRFTVDNGLHVSPSFAQPPGPQGPAPQAAAAPDDAPDVADLPAALRVLAGYAAGTAPWAGLEATVLAGLGATDPQGRVPAADAELAAPLAAMAFARVAAPAAASVAGPLGVPLVDAWRRTARRDDGAGPEAGRLAALEETVRNLERRVSSQARTITALRKAGGSR